jgi:hypothetical protein
MKKIILLSLAVLGMALNLRAQENKVVSAKMYLDDYTKDADTGSLKSAKEAIDLAAANDKTKDEPKMWLYKGMVYKTVFDKQLSNLVGKPTNKDEYKKANAAAYGKVDTTAICVAANSFVRVIQLVPKDYYADEARQMLPACSGHMENIATVTFGNGNYAVALAMFEKAIALGKVQGITDTSSFMVENYQNCAVTADRMHNTPKAIQYYQKMIELKVGGAHPYTSLVSLYNKNQDTTNAMATLRKARAAYPSDVNLLISETNVYLHAHKSDKAIANLQAAIDQLTMENKPDDKELLSNLYFVLGNTYDNLANPKTDSGASLPKPANYLDLFGKAEDNYQKALNLTPDNFDELFDMGALYNNRAIQLNREANDIPPTSNGADAKYNKLVAEANDYLKKAQPYLEKAHAKNPKDQATISALLNIYAGTGQVDKIKPLKDGN